jgi:hypothetical protein
VATFLGGDGKLLGKPLTDTVRDLDAGQQYESSIRYSSRVRAALEVSGYQLTSRGAVEQ